MASTREMRFRQGTSAERAGISAGLLTLGTLWYEENTGNFYEVVLVAGVHQYVLIAGGSGSSTFNGLLYVVDDNPVLAPFLAPGMGNKGPFQSVADALGQIAIDMPTRATILVMRGQYTESFALPVGVSIVGATQQGHNATSCVINGTITVSTGADTTIISGLRIVSSVGAILFSGAATKTLEITNCQIQRTTAGAALIATNSSAASVVSLHNTIVQANSEADTAFDGTTFQGSLEAQGSTLLGAVIGPLGDFQADTMIARGMVRVFGAAQFSRSTLTSTAAGVSPVQVNGSTLRLRGCIANVASAADAAITAASPSVVDLGQLEIRGGGRVFAGTVTSTALQGSRAHVISTSGSPTPTVDYTLDALVCTNAGATTTTLPLLDGYAQGKLLIVKKLNAGDITVSPSGGDLFDGAASLTVTSGFTVLLLGDRDLNQWRVIGFSSNTAPSGSAFPKYIVAEAGSPQEVAGFTYPDVDAATAAAITDFGVSDLRADILVMPGTFPAFTWEPGAYVQALSPYRPGDVAGSSNASVISGQITMSAAFAGGTRTTASLGGLLVTSTTDAILVPDGLNNFDVVITDCLLRSTAATYAPVAIQTASAPGTPGRMAFRGCTLQTADTNAVRADAGDVVGVSLRFENCVVRGGLRSDVTMDVYSSEVIVGTGVVLVQSGSLNLVNSTIAGSNAAGAILTLASGTTTSTLYSFVRNDDATQLSIDGSGSILLLMGAMGGVSGIAATVTVRATTSGRALATFGTGVTTDGYVAPVGTSTVTITENLEVVVLDCTSTAASSVIDLDLPNARTSQQFSELIIKRIDANLDVTVRLNCTGTNEFDRVTPAVQQIEMGPTDAIRILSSREPAGAVGRWLRVN